MKQSVDLNRVSLFVKLVEAGNITKAARHLDQPKAKLSRNLALLESELGIQLVYRTTRQFRLTDAGQLFYDSAKRQLEEIQSAIIAITEEDAEAKGHLRITAPEDLGILVVTDIIDKFSRLYPKIKFDLIYTNEMLDMVKLGIDIAIRIGNPKDSTLIAKRSGSVDFILTTSPIYLEKNKLSPDVQSLPTHQIVGFSGSSGVIQWKLRSQSQSRTLKIEPKITANNLFAVRDLIVKGHGIAILPEFVCEAHLASGTLVHIYKPWRNEGFPIQVTMPHQKNISKKVRLFFDFAIKELNHRFK